MISKGYRPLETSSSEAACRGSSSTKSKIIKAILITLTFTILITYLKSSNPQKPSTKLLRKPSNFAQIPSLFSHTAASTAKTVPPKSQTKPISSSTKTDKPKNAENIEIKPTSSSEPEEERDPIKEELDRLERERQEWIKKREDAKNLRREKEKIVRKNEDEELGKLSKGTDEYKQKKNDIKEGRRNRRREIYLAEWTGEVAKAWRHKKKEDSEHKVHYSL